MKNRELEDLQNCELDILKQFINVCDKLNVNYFVIGGTLIGAVRHKGFIPWDDDIDVCMLREDYEKFLREGQKYLDDKYFIQTYKTDNEYPNNFAKIRNSETTFIESSIKHLNINHGVYIDIFPLDNLYKYNKFKSKLISYSLLYDFFKQSNNRLKRIFNKIAKFIYGNQDKIKLCEKLDSIYTKCNNKNIDILTNYCGAWGIKKESHKKSDFDDYIMLQFEDIQVKAPIGYDRVLKDTYGDYMKLPPKEKQVAHHFSDVIDTKKSYKEYINIERKIK